MAGALSRGRLVCVLLLLLPLPAGSAALRDPTEPPARQSASLAAGNTAGATATPVDSYTVQSVVFGPGRRVALLNGHEVREGSVLGPVRVLQIERDAVVLERSGQRERIPVHPEVAHKSPVPPTAPHIARAKVKSHD